MYFKKIPCSIIIVEIKEGIELKNDHCPLCGNDNRCCHSQDMKSLGTCWCTKEEFPKKIFDQVPPEYVRKLCICKDCVEAFKAKSEC